MKKVAEDEKSGREAHSNISFTTIWGVAEGEKLAENHDQITNEQITRKQFEKEK